MTAPPQLPPSPRPRWPRPPALLAALIAVLLSAMPVANAAVPSPDAGACEAAIAAAEPDSHLPPRLLSAIAIVESGRADPATGRVAPWPWTIDIGGVGRTFETEAAAISAVQAAQQSGVRSIDVGCMQVNLMHHPHAFASLQDAFDPATNVRYAAGFLTALRAELGEWPAAVAAYHSFTPELGAPYADRVAAIWPLAGRFGMHVGMASKALAMASIEAEVDPYHVLTPEFRAQMVAAAEFRLQREGALQAEPLQVRNVAATTVSAGRPGRAKARARPLTTEALEAEVDPRHVLTPEFRARMVAAAAFRHQQEAALRAGPAASPSRSAAAAAPTASRIALAWQVAQQPAPPPD